MTSLFPNSTSQPHPYLETSMEASVTQFFWVTLFFSKRKKISRYISRDRQGIYRQTWTYFSLFTYAIANYSVFIYFSCRRHSILVLEELPLVVFVCVCVFVMATQYPIIWIYHNVLNRLVPVAGHLYLVHSITITIKASKNNLCAF